MVNQLPKGQSAVGFVEIGKNETVSFAHYYQPESRLQFAYDIEWRAIKHDGRAALLLSTKGLYCKPFDENGSFSWENSSLRAWLNGEFLKSSFTHGNEVLLLPTSCNDPIHIDSILPYHLPDQPGFREKRSDQDFVFLLSGDDLNLLSTDDCLLSPHWLADKSQIHSPHTVKWWLRPDSNQQNNCVNEDGSIITCAPDSEGVFVRPAVWIDDFYIQRVIMDSISGWKTLVRDAKDNAFDYKLFRETASQTFDILYLFRLSADKIPTYPKMVVELILLVSKFSSIDLSDETSIHKLALNAAEALCAQSIHWNTIYKSNPTPGQPGTLTNAFVMMDLEGNSIVVDTNDFDLTHPLDKEKLMKDGFYTL